MKLKYTLLKLSLVFQLMMLPYQKIFAQGFEITFGGAGTQICNSIAIGSDSSIYLLGFSSIGALGGTDFMLSKISLNGQLLWTKFLGTTHDDFGVSVLKTSNGLVLAGTTHDPLFNEQILIIVTDTSGAEINRYTYGSLEIENINSAKLCPDGGYLLAGYKTNSGSNYSYVIKLDSTFNVLWDASYGAGINDYASEAIMMNDNSFFIASDRKANLGGGTFDYNIDVIRADSAGLVVWDSVYIENFQNGSQGLFQNSSGNLIFYGETELFQFSPFDYFISSIDTNGNLLWRYTFGGNGSNALFDVIEDDDGYLIGTGYGNSASNGNDPLNLSVIKFDTSGTLLWQREYGFQGVDIGFRILPSPDGGYLIAGRATTVDDDDFYLLKVDEDGLTSLSDQNFLTLNKPDIYPNPFDDFFYVKSHVNFNKLNLFNVHGQLVFSANSYEGKENFSRIETSNLSQGVYLLELRNSDSVNSRTILIKK